MKTIGILGGMSPESTVEYYQRMIHEYTRRFGDHGYPSIITYSVSFQNYIDWLGAGRWDLIAAGLITVGERLADAGADVLVIATNTMHKVAAEVDAGTRLPLLSLLDVVAATIADRDMGRVGLLGTRFTMEEDFYPLALAARGISVVTPSPADRALVDGVVWDELVAGVIRDESRDAYVRIIDAMVQAGAEGVILGCTEIPLLIGEDDVSVPLFDTTQLHADAALAYALSGSLSDEEDAMPQEANITEPALLIRVNRLYEEGMTNDRLYEITRGNWVLGKRREGVEVAFTVYDGIIRQVFYIHGWRPAKARDPEQKRQNRWRFDGVVAEDLQHYVGQSVAHYFTPGAQNPIQYVNV